MSKLFIYNTDNENRIGNPKFSLKQRLIIHEVGEMSIKSLKCQLVYDRSLNIKEKKSRLSKVKQRNKSTNSLQAACCLTTALPLFLSAMSRLRLTASFIFLAEYLEKTTKNRLFSTLEIFWA